MYNKYYFRENRLFPEPYVRKKKDVNDKSAYLVDGARFTSKEEYPIIERWMVPKTIDDDVKIVPYNMAKYIVDPENWYLSTYCMDKEFNSIKKDPKKFLELASKFKGFIGFDYTIYYGMQKIKQKEIMNLNLSLTYYCGKRSRRGRTIPNIRIGNKRLSYEFLRAIPKKATIAIGSYGCIRSKKEQEVFKNFLSLILPILMPKNVLVYGGHPDDVFKEFEKDYHFVFCKEFRLNEYKGDKVICQNT